MEGAGHRMVACPFLVREVCPIMDRPIPMNKLNFEGSDYKIKNRLHAPRNGLH